ncbi:MAG: secretion activating protein [Clostridia bacterium]|nr:secretion activating protein [Clostridia bacterium]
MTRFHDVAKIVLKHEGGLVDDPYDRGGRTNLGITQNTLNRARVVIPGLPERVDGLNVSKALSIYQKLYWDACKCDSIPEPVDFLVFDAAINCGTGGAGKQLQRAINRIGGDLKVDGAIGPLTLAAVNAAFDSDSWRLLHAVTLERIRWHNSIVARDKSQTKFLHGWMNRILTNADAVGL